MKNEKYHLKKSILAMSIALTYTTNVSAQFGTTFKLSSLNGENGFIVSGINNEYSFASNTGDINNDGISDIIISTPYSDDNGNSSGSVYVVFGASNGFPENFQLSSLNGSNGFSILGTNIGDMLSGSNNSGDINNDGIDDLLIGASGSGINGTSSGTSYVIFGKSSSFSPLLELTTLNGTNGFTIQGEGEYDQSGLSLSFIQDLNGDSIDDILIGAHATIGSINNNQRGASYVVFGRSSSFSANIELSSLNGNNGFAIYGENDLGHFGRKVSSLGDINADGLSDISIVEDPIINLDSNYYSDGYVIFGKSSGFSSILDLSSLNGNNGFKINGIDALDQNDIGATITSAGDFNDDGIDDFMIGYTAADVTGQISGVVYIVFGSNQSFNQIFDLTSLNGNNGFIVNSIDEADRLGNYVNTVGDINNDGISDIIMSATAVVSPTNPPFDPMPISYVLFGSSQSFPTNFNLANINGINGFIVESLTGQVFSTITSVSTAGDINNDGIDDIILGGTGADIGGIDSVSGYVIYGRGDLIFKNDFE